jgi:hypothetical protein
MNKNRRIALLLAVLFCLSAVTFVAVAKYIKEIPFTGNVTFQADLVETFTLTESRAVYTDGTCSLVPDTSVAGNTYFLVPGVSIPKDPKIILEGKSAVPAYLYVEVIDKLPAKADYTVASSWTDLGITGPKGGKVYVYNTVLDNTTDLSAPIYILKDNLITVDKELPRGSSGTLDFHAYMAQVGSGQNPTTAFTANILSIH